MTSSGTWSGVRPYESSIVRKNGPGDVFRQFAERAQSRFGKFEVEPIHFTAPVKEELAYPVRTAFEQRTIRIPADPAIRADLRAIKKQTTAAGNLRFSADAGVNGHADRFWALALALHAAKAKPSAGTIRAVRVGAFEGSTL